MKIHHLAAVAVLSTAMSAPLVAQDESAETTSTTPNIYTECGIGAAVFPELGWAAALSNITWDYGITASASATMSPEQCTGASADAATMIIETYATMIEETAIGQGEHLSALMEIYSCSGEQQAAVLDTVRADMSGVVSNDAYLSMSHVEKSASYFESVDAAATSAGCAS